MKETALLAGRYRIDDLLGEGGTGSVRRAQDTLLGRTVAIKMLAPTYARDASFVERFYAEARLAARIVDPHVVAIFDIVSDDATHAIVMECIDGPSLAGVLARGGHLDEARTIDYARQILAALRAAHAQDIVHRDLKPANVLVAPSGALKVTDFGLARAVGPDDRTIVVPGALVGSVHYAAPEQIQGLPVGPAADLYSLGVMLYEFRFGSVPFRGDSAIEIALAHVHVPGPSFAALVERMTPGLARIVERLLRKDPRERYASAADLDAALGALAVASPGGAYGTDEPTLVGDAPIFVAPQPRPKRTAPSLPQSEGRARRIALAILGVIVAAAASCRGARAHVPSPCWATGSGDCQRRSRRFGRRACRKLHLVVVLGDALPSSLQWPASSHSRSERYALGRRRSYSPTFADRAARGRKPSCRTPACRSSRSVMRAERCARAWSSPSARRQARCCIAAIESPLG
ncbi:MAG: hypothetical protein NVS1B2_20810 [Vulcanimicrobiaceae bacterium]